MSLELMGAEPTKAEKITGSAIGLAGLGTSVYLFAKGHWGWALLNLFIITPVAVVGGTGLARHIVLPAVPAPKPQAALTDGR